MDDSSEDSVLLIEVVRAAVANKELGAVRVCASVRHREHTLVRVGEPDLLIIELFAVD